MNQNNNINVGASSSKRKRSSTPQSSIEPSLDSLPSFDEDKNNKLEFFKAKSEDQEAKKIKVVAIANKFIKESVILSGNVCEITKLCNNGLHEVENVEKVKTFDKDDSLATKFHNTALKLVAQHSKTQSLTDTVNHILAACNKTSESIRATRIDALKEETFKKLNRSSRRTVKTSNKPDRKFLKAKPKKIRFESPILNTNPPRTENITIETSSNNIEVEIPFNNQNGQFNQTLSVTFDNNKTDEIVAKFRRTMNKETLDFSTFQISQSDSEFVNFQDTDADINRELSSVEADDVPEDSQPSFTEAMIKEFPEKYKQTLEKFEEDK